MKFLLEKSKLMSKGKIVFNVQLTLHPYFKSLTWFSLEVSQIYFTSFQKSMEFTNT